MTDIKNLFIEFIDQFDYRASDQLWTQQSEIFHRFWTDKILDPNAVTSEADFDPIIRMLDTKAKGFNSKVDVAVAMTYVRQGVWYRTFKDLKSQQNLRELVSNIFKENDPNKLVILIDALQQANEPFKNGLTGKNANVLNALLFIASPLKFISSVSLSHRRQIIQTFHLGDVEAYPTYGSAIVQSNQQILNFLCDALDGNWSPRTLSKFLYSKPVQSLWLTKEDAESAEAAGPEAESVDPQKAEFFLEKHLEDFLVANWESSALGQEYELIEKDDEIVSQQYRTDIGKIDLLVKSKSNQEFTVIELKKGQTNDDTVGQLTRYMGWVKANLSHGSNVHGIIVAGGPDDRLKYALSVVPNTKFLIYRIDFRLEAG